MEDEKPIIVVTEPHGHVGSWIIDLLVKYNKFNIRCVVSDYNDDAVHEFKKRYRKLLVWECKEEFPENWKQCLQHADYVIHTDFQAKSFDSSFLLSTAKKEAVKEIIIIDDTNFMYKDLPIRKIADKSLHGSENTDMLTMLQKFCDGSNIKARVISTGIMVGPSRFTSRRKDEEIISYIAQSSNLLPIKNSFTHVQEAASLAISMVANRSIATRCYHITFGETYWLKDICDMMVKIGAHEGAMEYSQKGLMICQLLWPQWWKEFSPIQKYFYTDYNFDNTKAEELLGRPPRKIKTLFENVIKEMYVDGKIEESRQSCTEYNKELFPYFILVQSTMFVLGLMPYIWCFMNTGIWYGNPLENTMKNPNQRMIYIHVVLGITTFILMHKRRIHEGSTFWYDLINTYVLKIVVILTLCYVCFAQPSPISYKYEQLLTVPLIVLIMIFMTIDNKCSMVEAYTYKICLWGMICNCGVQKGMYQFIGWALRCSYGYGNHVFGIVCGNLMVLVLPLMLWIRKTGSLYNKRAFLCFIISMVPCIILPLEYNAFFRICKPTHDWSLMYPRYPYYPRDLFEYDFRRNTIRMGNPGYLDFCQFRSLMDDLKIDNEVLSSVFDMDNIWTLMLKTKLANFKLVETSCPDRLDPQFMNVEFMLYDKSSDEKLQFDEFQKYMFFLNIRNDVLKTAFHEFPHAIIHQRPPISKHTCSTD